MKNFTTSIGLLLLCVGCGSGNALKKNEVPIPRSSDTSASEKQYESDVVIRVNFWLERVKRNPYDSIAHIKAGTSLLLLARETGNHALYPQAESILRESLLIGPGSYEALAMLAFALIGQHRFSEAVGAAKLALEVNRHKETAWAALGDAEFEWGHLSKAKEVYTKVLQFDRSLFALTRWANLAIAGGDTSTALSTLAEAAEIGRNRGVANIEVARCYIQMGEIYFQLGQFNRAEDYYQKALVLWPDGYLPLEHLAELRASQNKLTVSSEIYSKVTKLTPHPDLLEAYAGVLERLGKTAEAKKFYQQAFDSYLLASERGDPSYFRHLAFFLTDQKKKPQLALVWAKKDLVIRPVAQSYATLSWVLYHMGSLRLAEQAMDKALINESSLNAIWLYRAGVVYRQGNRQKLAKRLLMQALNLNPNHPEALVIKQMLKSSSHNFGN